MRRWRAFAVAGALLIAGIVVLAAILLFLAPTLAYQIKDRGAEWLSGARGRTFRIALGSTAGAGYNAARVLNQYLKARSGYELELVSSPSPGNLKALLDPGERIDLAMLNTADDDARRSISSSSCRTAAPCRRSAT
jgi:TRAP-type uncharacterized transport system substrate-binding protein